MLIKVRKLGESFGSPEVTEKNGELTMQADLIGELVKVPDQYREPCELLVGELSMSLFPVGVEVAVEGRLSHLNGLWVQRQILATVKNQSAAAA